MLNKPNKNLWLALIMFSLVLVPVYAQEHDHDHGESQNKNQDHPAESESGHIDLSARDIQEFGIVTRPIGSGQLIATVDLPAEIHPNDDRLAHIVPRYEGLVTDVFVRVGDEVQAGQTLATIEGDASLAVFPLKTRIAGTVISKHITLGEAVSRDSRPFVIADLSTVWLDIHVFQRDLQKVHTGQAVNIRFGPGGDLATGKISYISPVLDESTRTATARAVLDNSQGVLRPGMFVNAHVEVDRVAVPLLLPQSAVFTLHDHPVAFIKDGHGFKVREIVLGPADAQNIAVLEGLAAGEEVVVQGGFTLKAELLKSSFDDGHNH